MQWLKQIKWLTPLAGAGLMLAFLVKVTPEDHKKYQVLLKESQPQTERTDRSTLSEHFREGVIKQIWYQKDKPLKLQLNSPQSALLFQRHARQFLVLEELGPFSCILQEPIHYLLPDGREAKLLPNGQLLPTKSLPEDTDFFPHSPGVTLVQTLRYFEAEEGSYSYTNQVLIAQEVSFWEYHYEGEELPEDIKTLNSTMQGHATSIELQLKKSDIDMTAENMTLTFTPPNEVL